MLNSMNDHIKGFIFGEDDGDILKRDAIECFRVLESIVATKSLSILFKKLLGVFESFLWCVSNNLSILSLLVQCLTFPPVF